MHAMLEITAALCNKRMTNNLPQPARYPVFLHVFDREARLPVDALLGIPYERTTGYRTIC